MPEISVIVPVYKVEQWLGPCVDSILNQTFRDFELILVDDGSPDNCGALCEKYAKDDPRVRVLHKANGGLSSARNAGIEAAKAPYLAFVDSDDFVRPQYLATLRAAIRQYGADMAICGAEDVTEWGESLPRPAYTQELEEGVHTGDELLPGFLRRGQRLLYRSLEQAVQGRTVEDPALPGWADPRGRCGGP